MRRMTIWASVAVVWTLCACSGDVDSEGTTSAPTTGTATRTATGTATGVAPGTAPPTGTGTGTETGTVTGGSGGAGGAVGGSGGSGTAMGGSGGSGTATGGSGGSGGASPTPECGAVSGICTEFRWVLCGLGMEPVDPDPHKDCSGDGWCCVDAPPSTCSDQSVGNCVAGSACEGCWGSLGGYACEAGRVCCVDVCD